jgi:succinate dehydrogenase/fumarate reductase flavoprotein subunit
MESEKLVAGSSLMLCHSINTLIIGSGAAALNAALSLHSMGVEDIVIATRQLGGGTSNNAGSDKQTYYKLSLSGTEPDSVHAMAIDLFNGRCMHGDIALCEAQGSVRSFMRLVDLGVPFPHDQYGSFAGYKTDHDPRSRATSAGPYTSKMMYEALLREVLKRNIRILDNHHCIALLTDNEGLKTIGAVAINTAENEINNAFVLFNAINVVLGTGGPAGIYETSVYPVSQEGSAGMAFKAGASGQNLTESQFGIASVKFRWNLSGSYQQAIPRYLSTGRNGEDEQEFLKEYFSDLRSLTRATFLKGYQWPFDPRKIKDQGSSVIDVLVDREINERDRRVFIDFMRNPSGSNNEVFSTGTLDPEVHEYLYNCGALTGSPYERLKAINPKAISLYLDHGIDLSREYLEIAVCAQHNNGGLKSSIWWESDLKHLFPVGEVNGSHGVFRPGGSALNSGQVGSFRAAQFISHNYRGKPSDTPAFMDEAMEKVNDILVQADRWLSAPEKSETGRFMGEIRRRMSAAGGIMRSAEKAHKAFIKAHELYRILSGQIGARNILELSGCFQLMDHCLTHLVYLGAIDYYISGKGRSRGSYIVSEKNHDVFDPDLCMFDREIEKSIIEVRFSDGKLQFRSELPREIPGQDLWFEKVWRRYLDDMQQGIV